MNKIKQDQDECIYELQIGTPGSWMPDVQIIRGSKDRAMKWAKERLLEGVDAVLVKVYRKWGGMHEEEFVLVNTKTREAL